MYLHALKTLFYVFPAKQIALIATICTFFAPMALDTLERNTHMHKRPDSSHNPLWVLTRKKWTAFQYGQRGNIKIPYSRYINSNVFFVYPRVLLNFEYPWTPPPNTSWRMSIAKRENLGPPTIFVYDSISSKPRTTFDETTCVRACRRPVRAIAFCNNRTHV